MDGIFQACIFIDMFVVVTLLSFLSFPEHTQSIQTFTLYFLLFVYLAKQLGEFLFRITSHCRFVKNNTLFGIRAANHPNPGAMYLCRLAWLNPQSLLDFRTYTITMSLYEPMTAVREEPPQTERVRYAHPYNTRSRRRG
jgi:hypothetical protein